MFVVYTTCGVDVQDTTKINANPISMVITEQVFMHKIKAKYAELVLTACARSLLEEPKGCNMQRRKNILNGLYIGC